MHPPEAIDFGEHVGRHTSELIGVVLAEWPEHAKFLKSSFSGRSQELLNTTEEIAGLLVAGAGQQGQPLSTFARDYRYLCEEIVFPEEVFFRREGRYRLSTFEEAAREVYDNAPLMARYMNGLFVSDALWLNHASAMNDFVNHYLPASRVGGRHLEIGPGHGMLLHLATKYGRFSNLSAWDVSETSIAHAHDLLSFLGSADGIDLRLQDLYAPKVRDAFAGQFDAIVLSEVLEHLEQPKEALEIIRDILAPGGSVWINVPANGPAPDHLFLLRSPDEAAALVAEVGLEIARTAAYPLAGSSLERAVRQELPISCIVVGKKPA